MKQNVGCALPFLLSLLLAVLILFSACSRPMASDRNNAAGGMINPSVKEEFYDQEAGDQTDGFEQKRILKGHITAESTDFDTALDTLEQKIAALNGYIGSSEIYGNSLGASGRRRATLTARIPAASFRTFLDGLSDFLNVTAESTTSQDITESYYDTESKLNSLRVQEERILAMLEKAEDLDTLLKLEDRLSEIRQQIEYYDSLLRAYDSQVDYATVTVTLYEVITLSEPEPEDPSFGQEIEAAFKNSWSGFVEAMQGLLLTLIYLLPLLIVALVVFLVIFLSVKKTAAKRKARAAAERERYEAMRAASQSQQKQD